MALIKCPECGKEISDKAKACPNCGAPISVIAGKTVPVTFTRPHSFGGKLIHADALIDERKVGTINDDESFTVKVPVGTHRVTIETNLSEGMKRAQFTFGGNVPVHGAKFRILEVADSTNSVHITCKVVEGIIDIVDISQR